MAELEKKWYVLKAISGKELKVKEYLEADTRNNKLEDFIGQVLIPTEIQNRVSRVRAFPPVQVEK